MKSKLKIIVMAQIVCSLLAGFALAESFYCGPNTTAAAVNIGPVTGARTITHLNVYTPVAASTVDIEAGSGPVAKVLIAQANTTATLYVNTTNGFAASDEILVAHPDGTVDYTTVNGAPGTTNITPTATSKAAAVGTRIWKVTTQASYRVPWQYDGTSNATVVPVPLDLHDFVFTAYGTPMRIKCSATNSTINATTTD